MSDETTPPELPASPEPADSSDSTDSTDGVNAVDDRHSVLRQERVQLGVDGGLIDRAAGRVEETGGDERVRVTPHFAVGPLHHRERCE